MNTAASSSSHHSVNAVVATAKSAKSTTTTTTTHPPVVVMGEPKAPKSSIAASASSDEEGKNNKSSTVFGGNAKFFIADFFASWAATSVSITLSHPLDTLRIRAQKQLVSFANYSSPHLHSTAAPKSNAKIFAHRARILRDLYSGVQTPLLTLGPCIALSIAANDFYQRALCYHALGTWNLCQESKQQMSFWHFALAGALAGATASVVQTPVAVIRITQQTLNTTTTTTATVAKPPSAERISKSQLHHSRHFSAPPVSPQQQKRTSTSIASVCKMIYNEGGSRAFMKGFHMECTCAAIGRLVYFASYEKYKQALPEIFDPEEKKLSLPLHMSAAILASWSGWIAIAPADIVKTHLQSHNNGATTSARDVIKKIFKESGFRGFFRGFHVTMARAVVSSGVSLPLADYLKPPFRRALTGHETQI